MPLNTNRRLPAPLEIMAKDISFIPSRPLLFGLPRISIGSDREGSNALSSHLTNSLVRYEDIIKSYMHRGVCRILENYTLRSIFS